MIDFSISTDAFLLVANAFEFGVSIAAIILLALYVWRRIGSVGDFARRTWRAINMDFQGGSYDLAMAILVIFIGKTIRTEAVWEWRLFDGELSTMRVGIGIIVSTVGALCLVRILAPEDSYNVYWLSTIVFATALTIFSYWYS